VSPPFDLDAFLKAQVPAVDAALDRALTRASARVDGRLHPGVLSAIQHGVRSGGKRLRPILCAEAYHAAGGQGGSQDQAYDLAASLEMIHAYSLMHDDLPCMDDAELRRGVPTTHRVHGVGDTVLGGVALIPLAALQALESARALGCPEATCLRITQRLMGAAGAGGMVGGQGLDLLGEDQQLSSDQLDELHAHKTGALLTVALVMGGLAAGAPAAVLEGLEAYGRRIGLAFQIADDVLDATASTEALGKKPSDAELGKSTYVALHGLDEARARGETEVEHALRALDRVGLDAPPLRALARYVVERRN
jgi:geranylgeranyl pyrophosphate synthase